MQKIYFCLTVLFLFSSIMYPQIQKGTMEMSFSGALGSYSISYESKYYNEDYDAETYFLAAIRMGFFVTHELEIEPELNFLIQDETGVNIGANLAYNFDLAPSKVYPFIMAGAGIGNSVSILNIPGKSSDDFNVFHFNIGGGIKILITESVAARVEYRYRKYSKSEDNIDMTYNTHNLLFGFSIFL